MKIATIDVGTNTALLLVADCADGCIKPTYQEERFVRLGEGVDAQRCISKAAMERLAEALQAYRQAAEVHGAETIIVGATSASRDAKNRDELKTLVKARTGLDYRILSGEEEAVLSFRGAVSAFLDLQGPCAVLDIGGGSTEFIVGDARGGDEALRYRRSLDIGAVRLTERLFSAQPPAPAEIEEAEALVQQALEEAAVPYDAGLALVGAAGTPTALALVHGQVRLQQVLDHPPALEATDVRRWRDRVLTMTYDEVLALHDEAMPGRADVFPAGVLILDAVMQRTGAMHCRVSPRGLRHGLALVWAARQAA